MPIPRSFLLLKGDFVTVESLTAQFAKELAKAQEAAIVCNFAVPVLKEFDGRLMGKLLNDRFEAEAKRAGFPLELTPFVQISSSEWHLRVRSCKSGFFLRLGQVLDGSKLNFAVAEKEIAAKNTMVDELLATQPKLQEVADRLNDVATVIKTNLEWIEATGVTGFLSLPTIRYEMPS